MTEIKSLKARSGPREISRLLSHMDVVAEKHLATKVDLALRSIGAEKLATKIARCSRRAVCSSIYCRKCRNDAVSRFEHRLLKRFSADLHSRPGTLQDRWTYLTVLCAVTDFKLKPVAEAVDAARNILKKFYRKYPEAMIRGAFEFELVDLDDLKTMEGISSVKKETFLWMMNADQDAFKGRKILVHYHAVVDVAGYDVRQVRSWFEKQYGSHPRQIQLKYTERKQPASEKIRKIASYAFKNRLQYNTSFETRGYETGAFFSNRDAGRLIKLYQDYTSSRSGSYKSLLISVGGRD